MASIISIAFIIFMSYFLIQLPQGAPTSCPSSFGCATLGVLGYPFTTSFNPSCGLSVLNCTEPTLTIGLTNSGPWYDVMTSFSNNRSFLVGDYNMFHIVNDKCDVIENRFMLPRSSSVSFTALMNKTLWDCPTKFDDKKGNRSGTLRRLTDCPYHNVYHMNDTLAEIPGCDVVQYPSLVMVDLSDQCSHCISESGRCQDLPNDGFRCIIKRKERFGRWLLLASGASALVVILIALVIYAGRRFASKFTVPWSTTAKGNQNMEAFLKIYGSLAPKRYTYSDIKLMTNSFKHKLGEGGYGTVYKGKLQDDRFVAVKKLKNIKGNGEEFINEVVSISRTNHVNVVSLLGFCSHENKRALVYEFMPNGSLEKYLCNAGSGPRLPLKILVDIAVGVARGLDYLHRGCIARILHFDIKPHNILLDQQFCPKISDFGLAKLSDPENSMTSMWEARGTIGYIAPEVFCRSFGAVSHKSDVYSYGMLVLDMACGRKNLLSQTQNGSEQYFPDWIYKQIEVQEEIGVHGIIDNGRGLVRKMILVGLWCIQTYPSIRPSMNGVVEMLEGELESIKMPPKPHLCSPPRSGIESFSALVNTP